MAEGKKARSSPSNTPSQGAEVEVLSFTWSFALNLHLSDQDLLLNIKIWPKQRVKQRNISEASLIL